MIFGTYAYRFNGHALKKKSQHFLVGVGTMTLDAGLKIKGQHRASLLDAKNYAVQTSAFSLEGTFAQIDQLGRDFEAKITFTRILLKEGDKEQVLKATFSLVPAGSSFGFWLISTHTFNVTDGQEAEEVVSGEALLIG